MKNTDKNKNKNVVITKVLKLEPKKAFIDDFDYKKLELKINKS